jgi:hypothetical protein
MKQYIMRPAREVRIGDYLIEPDMVVGEISHGPRDGQIRFRDERDTATTFRLECEFVAIERGARS